MCVARQDSAVFCRFHLALSISFWALIVCVPVLFTGCGSGEGTVGGTVILQGTPPAERPIAFDVASGGLQTNRPVTTRHYVVNSNGGLANVLVFLKLDSSSIPAPARTNVASLDIHRAFYEPYVSAVQTNQSLELRNQDPIGHHASILPPPGNANKSRGLGLPTKRPALPLAFPVATVNSRTTKTSWRERIARWLRWKPAARAGGGRPPRRGGSPSPFIQFKCDVHPWEYAYVAVLDHPFFAVTGSEGTFELPPLPAGRYTLEAVHLKAGMSSQRVTIGRGERKRVTIVMNVPVANPQPAPGR